MLRSTITALLRISQMKKKKERKKEKKPTENYSITEGGGVWDTISQNIGKLGNLVTYIREDG